MVLKNPPSHKTKPAYFCYNYGRILKRQHPKEEYHMADLDDDELDQEIDIAVVLRFMLDNTTDAKSREALVAKLVEGTGFSEEKIDEFLRVTMAVLIDMSLSN